VEIRVRYGSAAKENDVVAKRRWKVYDVRRWQGHTAQLARATGHEEGNDALT
jgi:ABC-type Fe2+-enterobactin transport system substrate-binding protein